MACGACGVCCGGDGEAETSAHGLIEIAGAYHGVHEVAEGAHATCTRRGVVIACGACGVCCGDDGEADTDAHGLIEMAGSYHGVHEVAEGAHAVCTGRGVLGHGVGDVCGVCCVCGVRSYGDGGSRDDDI